MKKEKKVKSYQRRTKSGKTITVRAHTASYEAAEKAKEAAKKKGAGDEITERKKKNWELPMDEFLKKIKEERSEKKLDEETDKSRKSEDKKPKKSEKKTEKKTPNKKRTVGTETNGPEPKKKTTTKKTVAKKETSEPAFTKDEFKEWYRGTGSAADKKVAKALRKQLGRSGYRKFEDEAIDNYTSRGHLSMFKRVSGENSPSSKAKSVSASSKTISKVKADKLPSVGQKVSLKNWMGGKSQSYEVVGVQKATKASKEESGLQNWLWVKDKKGNIHAATQEEDGKIGIDSTWTDFTDTKSHPYASSLKKAGYSLRKKSGSGGEYWDVVKTSTKTSKKVSKPTLNDKTYADEGSTRKNVAKEVSMGSMSREKAYALTGLKKYAPKDTSKSTSVTISKVPTSAKNKIIDYVQRATDGEYASGKYTWKDTLAALRHPSESTVRERVERMYGVKVDGVKKKRSVGTGTNGPELKNKKQLISEQSLNSKGFKTFKMPQVGTLYLGKKGKGAYIKFKGKKSIQKADIDDYGDFITGHNGLTKSQKKQLSSLGYTEHEEY